MLKKFKEIINLINFQLLIIGFLTQCLVVGLASNLAVAEEIKHIGTGAIIRVSPTYGIALTTIDERISVQDKADAIIELIKHAPKNKIIYIVIEPNTKNNSYYNQLISLIDIASQEAKKIKGVQVRLQMVNYKLTAKIKEYLQAENQKINQDSVEADNYVLRLQGSDVIFSEQDAPKNLVTAIQKESSLLRMSLLAPVKIATSTVSSLKNLSVSGLAIATGLTYLGMNTVAPSWVYVSDGAMSKEMIMSFALSTALLYSIPRNENLTREYFDIAYDFLRSPWQALRALALKVTGRNVYLNQANPKIYNAFKVGAGVAGFSIPLQMGFYYLQDGNITENLEFIIKNALLIGAASSPYSFLTEKLKNQTHLSTNAVTHLRTLQLGVIGILAAAIPAHNGLDASLYNINTMEEAILLAMGAVGVFANYKGVDLVNKLDKNRFYRYINANFQALTDATGNFIRKKVGLKSTDAEFLSMDEILAQINAEIEGLTEGSQIESIATDMPTNQIGSQIIVNDPIAIPSFISHRAGICVQYLIK